ncbi:MAG: VWA domain-containing protein [Anaerolineae bacterium]|nr:VWA domain-containing protein [Anaerolineae bacterium]
MSVKIDAEKDFYAVLGISQEAMLHEIKQAYRKLARRYHPDSLHGDAQMFRQVQEAYEMLGDPVMRRAYDQQRRRRGFSEKAAFSLDLTLSRDELPILDSPQMLYAILDVRPKGGLDVIRQSLNLALVIDRSTSMNGARINNVKIAAQDLIAALRPEDYLALVAFSDRAEVLTPSTQATNKTTLYAGISSLNADGGTEIYRGLAAGLDEVRKNASDRYINHVILLTDGRTYGDEARCLSEVRLARSEGIEVSALGIGEDWNDIFLDELACNGGGISQYISSPSQVRDLLQNQIQGLSSVLARKLRLKFGLPPNVKVKTVYRAGPYLEHLSKQGIPNTFLLGKLGAEEPTAIVVEFIVKLDEGGRKRICRVELEAEDLANLSHIQLHRDIEVDVVPEPEEQEIPQRLINLLARLSIFQLQERAWDEFEIGHTKQATSLLEAAATQLFDMGYQELAGAAMLEANRLSQGEIPSAEGRKKLRYGTRTLATRQIV